MRSEMRGVAIACLFLLACDARTTRADIACGSSDPSSITRIAYEEWGRFLRPPRTATWTDTSFPSPTFRDPRTSCPSTSPAAETALLPEARAGAPAAHRSRTTCLAASIPLPRITIGSSPSRVSPPMAYRAKTGEGVESCTLAELRPSKPTSRARSLDGNADRPWRSRNVRATYGA